MELTKKTTILFSPDLHRQLSKIAKSKGVSLGELIRAAMEAQYGIVARDARVRAVAAMRKLSLPVGTPRRMKRESVPSPPDLDT